jgi:hypothetical protein
MKSNDVITSASHLRRISALLIVAIGIITAGLAPTALAQTRDSQQELTYLIALPASLGGGGDGGGDIIVFDIVDSVSKSSRGGGGDIIIFDIVDSAAAAGQPTRGGGGDGGDIIVWDIVDSVARIEMSAESHSGVYKAVLIEGDRELAGLVAFEKTSTGKIVLSFMF